MYCGQIDSPEHTIFDCPKWNCWRLPAEAGVSEKITPSNMVELMVSSEAKWTTIEANGYYAEEGASGTNQTGGGEEGRTRAGRSLTVV